MIISESEILIGIRAKHSRKIKTWRFLHGQGSNMNDQFGTRRGFIDQSLTHSNTRESKPRIDFFTKKFTPKILLSGNHQTENLSTFSNYHIHPNSKYPKLSATKPITELNGKPDSHRPMQTACRGHCELHTSGTSRREEWSPALQELRFPFANFDRPSATRVKHKGI
jgi:hypothetical protein